MEYSRHYNQWFPLATDLGKNKDFVKNFSKEIKQKKQMDLEIEGVTATRNIKDLSIKKAKLVLDEKNKAWHFSCKAIIKLAD